VVFSFSFGRLFVKWFALYYPTVVLSVCPVPSVCVWRWCIVVGQIKIKLGTQVGLSTGHTVLQPRWGPSSSRFDYCNAVLAGLPRSTISPMQRVQNATVRHVARLGPRDYVIPTLKNRHWLPIEQRILFKLCLLMHQVHTGSCVTASADMTSHPHLRSVSSQWHKWQHMRLKFGERSFSCAGPRACRHHCTNWQTLALLNVIYKLFFYSKHTNSSLRYICCLNCTSQIHMLGF